MSCQNVKKIEIWVELSPKVFDPSPNEAVRLSLCGAFRALTLWLTNNINMKWLTLLLEREDESPLARRRSTAIR